MVQLGISKKEKFTALLYHISPDSLRLAFYALKRDAAPGADGMTWQEYEQNLDARIEDCTTAFTAARIGRCLPDGPTSRRQTEAKDRWR